MNKPHVTPPREPETPADMVICAIGDVHGRLDLLEAATDELRRTALAAAAAGKRFVAIFLGDYIDRGPDSQGVIAHLMALRQENLGEVIFLRGNHEQTLLDLADGVDDTLPWLDYGGLETLRSYGVELPPRAHGPALAGELGRQINRAVPQSHLQFVRETELYAKCGDYLFVHAGLRPDRLMDEQSAADMLWFRYYADEPPVHGEFVIHGHSTNDRPILGRWRIGIDTEAYATGDLTILRLEGAEREFLRVRAPSPGAPPQVGHWSSIDSSYSRREPKASNASTSEAPRRAPRRSGRPTSLLLVALFAAVAVAGGLIFATGIGGPRSKAPAAIGPKPAAAAPVPTAIPPEPAPAPSGEPELRQPIATPAAESPPPRSVASVIPAQAAAPTTGGRRVQIGALDSPQAARKAWDKVASDFPDLMRAKTFEQEQTESGGRTYFRAYVAGFADGDAARQFCRQIGAAELACIVR